MNILNQIVDHKKGEVARAKKTVPLSQLQTSAFYNRIPFSLKYSLNTRNGIIAEFKRKSPSKGIINSIESVFDVVSKYEEHGASGISILTDRTFFGGSNEDLQSVREKVNIPILRKDFIVDEYQIYEAKALGADVILFIAACLSPQQTVEFAAIAKSLNLEVLLEIHTEEEVGYYNKDVDLVGINNRNLKDFRVDLQHSVQLKNKLPYGAVSVAESGIYSIEDFNFLKAKGFDGFLMGEYFMKNENPGQSFEAFSKAIKR